MSGSWMPLRDRQPVVSGQRPRLVCYRCFKPQVACICGSIERVANQTGITILQHPRERFHAIGTVRIVRLALENVRVEQCAQWSDGSALRAQLADRSALLFPTVAARELARLPIHEHPRHLVILDGTWFQAKKVYEAHQWLHDLPHVCLTPTAPSRYRIRPEPRRSYVATLEAIVYALRIIEPQTRGLDSLLRSFAAMVDRQASYTPAMAR